MIKLIVSSIIYSVISGENIFRTLFEIVINLVFLSRFWKFNYHFVFHINLYYGAMYFKNLLPNILSCKFNNNKKRLICIIVHKSMGFN